MILSNLIEIRKTISDDAIEIANIHLLAWKNDYKNIIDQEYLTNINFEKKLEQRYKIFKENEITTLVAIYNKKIVGFCDFGKLYFHSNQHLSQTQKDERTERGEITSIYLVSEYQNKGIGSILFYMAKEKLKEISLFPFIVWALKDNINACKFYQKQGGILVDEIFVTIGNKNYHEVAYRFR